MSATFDAKMSAGNADGGQCESATGATSISSTGMTVGAGANRVLVAKLVFASGDGSPPTGVTMTWNGVAMTERAHAAVAVNNYADAYIFVLVNPASGNNTLAAAWTSTQDAYMSCISFTEADQSTGINTADTVTATQTDTINVPTDADGATVSVFASNGNLPTLNQTEIFTFNPLAPTGAAQYAIGGTGTVAHTYTAAAPDDRALAGVHVIAAAGGLNVALPVASAAAQPQALTGGVQGVVALPLVAVSASPQTMQPLSTSLLPLVSVQIEAGGALDVIQGLPLVTIQVTPQDFAGTGQFVSVPTVTAQVLPQTLTPQVGLLVSQPVASLAVQPQALTSTGGGASAGGGDALTDVYTMTDITGID